MTSFTAPRPFVFVLMPFSAEFDDTYRLAIRPACEKAGAYAERVDDQIFEGSILQRIYNQIAKADVIIADLSGRNPNVFYETGYAHALGKRTLLLTHNVDDIPFDLKHFPHIVYGGRLTELLAELERRVRWYIENLQTPETNPGDIVVRVNGQPLVDGSTINAKLRAYTQIRSSRFIVDIHNSLGRGLRKLECQIGFVTPRKFNRSHSAGRQVKVLMLEDGKCLHLPGISLSIFPAAWEGVELAIESSDSLSSSNEDHAFEVRVFTESGAISYPFRVTFEVEEKNG